MKIEEYLNLDLQDSLTKTIFLDLFTENEFNTSIKVKVGSSLITTTLGRYTFNKFVLPRKLYETHFFNEEIDKKSQGKFFGSINDEVKSGLLTNEDFASAVDRVNWLSGQALKIQGGGVNVAGFSISKKTKEKIKKLVDTITEEMSNDDYLKVENMVIDILKKELGESDLGKIVGSGSKGSFAVHIKEMFGFKNRTITNNLGSTVYDDLTKENSLEGSYSRSVLTAKGGYASKQIINGLQHVSVDSDDCGTQNGISIFIRGLSQFDGRFVKLKNSKGTVFKALNRDTIKEFINKSVIVRSPMYCKSKKGLCKKCVGESVLQTGYDKALFQLGVAVSSAAMNVSMKAFHDTSVKYQEVNFMEFVR